MRGIGREIDRLGGADTPSESGESVRFAEAVRRTLRRELEVMLGLRGGHALRHVPAHHGVELGRPMTHDERLAQATRRVVHMRSAWTFDAEGTPKRRVELVRGRRA